MFGESGAFGYSYGTSLSTDGRPCLNIVRASKTTLAESLPIFYDSNTFYVHEPRALLSFCRSTHYALLKLKHVKHLAFDHNNYIDSIRINELRKLDNLQRVTVMAGWSYAPVWSPVELDLSIRDSRLGDEPFDDLRQGIAEWPQRCCGTFYLRDLMRERPNITYEVVAQGRFQVMDYTSQPPSFRKHVDLSVLFTVTWDPANNRDRLRYEDEDKKKWWSVYTSYQFEVFGR